MDAERRAELERQIRDAWDREDRRRAAELAIQGYEPEIFGFLVAFHRDENDATEVWSRVTERVWTNFDRFGWQSSFRTWIYVIARNTSIRYRQERRRREGRLLPFPEESQLSELRAPMRTGTASYLRTDNKNRFSVLREALSEEDQILLVLRVDKQLAWNELARVMRGDDETVMRDEELKREAAKLRKRFQLIKERLLEMRKSLE